MFGYKDYNVVVVMEWTESPEWVRTHANVRARSRIGAAVKGLRAAQRNIESGWASIKVERVEELT